ncbi:hypothetical protein SVAN01_08975 [Stagonosporopsis vannaccii]|nr:hypothetical protein SVAN01_08975 [Stagonosporopsis vannaccii]
MSYHLPASHAILLTLLLVSFFCIGFGVCLWRSCGRAVDAEFVAMGDARAQGQGARGEDTGVV